MSDKRIGFLLERTTRIAKLSFTKVFKELDVNITPEQWVIVDILSEKDELYQKDLGTISFKNAPTISRIIDNLVKKDWVTRMVEEGDRRKTRIRLTEGGRAIHQQCVDKVSELRRQSWQGLTEEEYTTFVQILDKVFANFEGYE